MEETGKRTYRLYALPPTPAGIEAAMGERYSRITPLPAPGYALIYTADGKPDGSEEITDDKAHLLSDDDKQWLMSCGASILAEEAMKQEPEIMARISENIEALEAELRRRQAELNAKEG